MCDQMDTYLVGWHLRHIWKGNHTELFRSFQSKCVLSALCLLGSGWICEYRWLNCEVFIVFGGGRLVME